MPPATALRSQLLECLNPLYGQRAAACLDRIMALAARFGSRPAGRDCALWDERDVVLITYGDQVRRHGQAPLETLRQFLLQQGLRDLISIVHVLPFCPSSSDDGFSVSDYRQVDPALGAWQDLHRLGESFSLMFDLVLNHCSARHDWFQAYLAGRPPYTGYFIEADPALDLSLVTRPRSSPVLTSVQTATGLRHVWTTFSADQVDLNWSNPELLLEMLDILLFYVAQGARIIRLDAIAYLWKRVGTPCIHLPETHLVVKLLRRLLDALAPGTLLLTETNVPQRENLSYFGAGDEAHLVYQFSLPPLALDAFSSGDARAWMDWLAALEPARPGTAYLNFTASHDGVGLRPLEELLPAQRVERLIAAMHARGGLISTRRLPDGRERAYELNIAYFSALDDPDRPGGAAHVRRFLASQAVMLALRGIPAVYFHSLVATPNALDGVRQTGRARSINRHKFDWDPLQARLADPNGAPRQVLDLYRHMLDTRRQQPAFHPDAHQEVVALHPEAVVSFLRICPKQGQHILVAVNVSHRPVSVALPAPFDRDRPTALLSIGAQWETTRQLQLSPAGAVWLRAAGT